MARSRRGPPPRPVSRSASTSAAPAAHARPAPTPARAAAPAPQAHHAPPPAAAPPAPMASPVPAPASSGGGGMLSGIGSTIVQGMAFGTGSAIAHRAVGAIADSFSGGGTNDKPEVVEKVVNPPPEGRIDYCKADRQMFYDCLKENENDQAQCNFLYEQLKSCQINASQFG